MNSLRKIPFSLLYNLTSVSSRCYKRSLNTSFNSIRRFATYEGDGKTSANIINLQENLGLMIISYSPHGFRLNNKLFVRGSMAIFPNTVMSWQVEHIDEINEESLSIFPILEPAIDIVVIGCGDAENITQERRANLINIMKKFQIPVEILPTDVACTTFNFLVAESRFVGAVLLPQKKSYNLMNDKLQRMVDEHGLLS